MFPVSGPQESHAPDGRWGAPNWCRGGAVSGVGAVLCAAICRSLRLVTASP